LIGKDHVTQHGDSSVSPNQQSEGTTVIDCESDLSAPPLSSLDSARRVLPEYDGIYTVGAVEGIQVKFTIATGATTTLLSSALYNRIPEEVRPSLVPCRRYSKAANGLPINNVGQAMVTIQLGPLTLTKLVVVADIENEALLGSDILLFDEEGPANLLLSEYRIVLRGVSIPVQLGAKTSPVRQVGAADHSIIPQMSETVLDIFVDGSRNDSGDTSILLEHSPKLLGANCLAPDASMVDVANSTTVEISIINPLLTHLKESQHSIVCLTQALSAFNFAMEYRPGKLESNADAMSFCIDPTQCQHLNVDKVSLLCDSQTNHLKQAEDTSTYVHSVPNVIYSAFLFLTLLLQPDCGRRIQAMKSIIFHDSVNQSRVVAMTPRCITNACIRRLSFFPDPPWFSLGRGSTVTAVTQLNSGLGWILHDVWMIQI